MDVNRINQILNDTTQLFRKGEPVTEHNVGEVHVTEMWGMPHLSEASADLEQIDCHFMVVGVDKVKAQNVREELVRLLKNYPQPGRLKQGLSYIEVGGELDSKEMAFRLFALGKILGFWEIITPESLGVTGPAADQMAGLGMIYTSGYNG